MARQKTGEKLGRPFIYTSKDERPVTLSLRVPRDLFARLEAYRTIHYRQSVTELLLDGLRWRLDEANDPRWPSQNGTQHYGNTSMREEAAPSQPVPQTALIDMALTPGMLDEDEVSPVPGVPLAALPVASVASAGPPAEPALGFDAARFFLGDLCKSGHAYARTTQSLRKRAGKQECQQCCRDRDARYRERKRQTQPV